MTMTSTRIALLCCIGALIASAASEAAAPQRHVFVYFLRGEQLASVQRNGSTPLEAMRHLVAGPTAAERAQGFRTYLPAKTRVLSVAERLGFPSRVRGVPGAG